jgi:hypothetical protein
MYIAQFSHVPFGTEYLDAIGIFKSESKETFLKYFLTAKVGKRIAEEYV